MKLPKIRFTKKVVVIAAAAGLAMGAAGIAAAYFSATGNGTGIASVGAPTTFTVQQNGLPTGTIYPGVGTSVQKFQITNTGGGVQHYTIVPGNVSMKTAASPTTAYAVTITSTLPLNPANGGHTGCLASWFAVSTPAASGTLAPGTTVTVTVTITLPNIDATQTGCQNAHPEVLLHVGS